MPRGVPASHEETARMSGQGERSTRSKQRLPAMYKLASRGERTRSQEPALTSVRNTGREQGMHVTCRQTLHVKIALFEMKSVHSQPADPLAGHESAYTLTRFRRSTLLHHTSSSSIIVSSEAPSSINDDPIIELVRTLRHGPWLLAKSRSLCLT